MIASLIVHLHSILKFVWVGILSFLLVVIPAQCLAWRSCHKSIPTYMSIANSSIYVYIQRRTSIPVCIVLKLLLFTMAKG